MRVARTLWEAVWIILFLAGTPVVLVRLAGLPSLKDLPDRQALVAWIAEPLTPGFVGGCLAAVAWLLWALVVAVAVARVTTRLSSRRRWLARVRLPAPVQGLAAALLGAAAVSSASPALAHPTTPVAVTDTHPDQAREARPTTVAGGSTTTRTEQAGTTVESGQVTVRRGDTLWKIADTRLDDPTRWREIYRLNADQYPLRGGHHLRPGWVLALPSPPEAPTIPPSQQPPPAPTEDQSPPTTADDGTAAPAAPQTSGPTTHAPSPDGEDLAGGQGEECPPGVSLPDGWIGIGVATAIMAAATLVVARRRRHDGKPPPPPGTPLDEADLAGLPPVVTDIQRALLDQTSTPDTPADDVATTDGLDDPEQDSRPAGAIRTGAAPGHAHLDWRARPWPAHGLAVIGPGALAAARGILADALTMEQQEEPDVHGHVVVDGHTLAVLTGGTVHSGSVPGLAVTGGLPDALALLEQEILHRSRILADHDADTITDLRDTAPDIEPLPSLLLIADATTATQDHARLTVLLAQGHHLDIRGLLLGVWPQSPTVTMAPDGATSPTAADEPDTSQGGWLPVVDTAAVTDLLRLLAESGNGQAPAGSATTTESAAVSTGGPGPDQGHNDKKAVDPSPTRPDNGTHATDRALQPDERDPQQSPDGNAPAIVETAATGGRATTEAQPPDDAAGQVADVEGRVRVQVLGAARIVDVDTTIPLRAKSLELLVYLAVHNGEATQDAILDDLLPEAPAAKAPHRLHTYVSALRKTLKLTGGPGTYLTHPSHRYALNHRAFDIDLWRMRDAIRDAERATNGTDRITALRRAVDAYDGGLADGFDYEWIEAYREAVRRQARDAHLALAAALTDPAEALAVVEAAIVHDPYAEPLYQQAMRAHAALGQPDQVHALHQALARRLQEIDAEPSPETTALADQLTANVQHRGVGRRKTEPHSAGSGHEHHDHRPRHGETATSGRRRNQRRRRPAAGVGEPVSERRVRTRRPGRRPCQGRPVRGPTAPGLLRPGAPGRPRRAGHRRRPGPEHPTTHRGPGRRRPGTRRRGRHGQRRRTTTPRRTRHRLTAALRRDRRRRRRVQLGRTPEPPTRRLLLLHVRARLRRMGDARRQPATRPPTRHRRPPTNTTGLEVLGHWLRHPVITSRARTLAKTDGLDLYESLKAARTEIRREHRDAAIAKVLHRKIRKAVDPTTAKIAVQVYDLDEIAARLAADADYDRLSAIISADLAPERMMTGGSSKDGRKPGPARYDGTDQAPTAGPSTRPIRTVSEATVIDARDTLGQGTIFAPDPVCFPQSSDSAPDLDGTLDDTADGAVADSVTRDDDRHDDVPADLGPDHGDSRAPTETAEAVAYWLGVDPEMDLELIAGRIGKSLRSVYRHLPPDYPRKPGVSRARGRSHSR
ncbi:BTAD domain-containing putative transcriptional regulator [Polymorphospora rubra]|uniref:BTAD domain-containing putative transcriptional regulator n=1 Tax=Polymorphospora rubra TaxID=338584 RepID=UPI0033C2C66C